MPNSTFKIKRSFTANLWRQLKADKIAMSALWIMGAFLLVSLVGPIVANNKPLYLKYYGENFFPAFSSQNNYQVLNPNTGELEEIQLNLADWKRLNAERIIWAPIVYAPGISDRLNSYLNADYKAPLGAQFFKSQTGEVDAMPGRFRHWLGTGKKGEDVLSGLIWGTRFSLMVGLGTMLIAGIIGLILGALAGYFGDNRLTTSRGMMLSSVTGLVFSVYYGIVVRIYILMDSLEDSIFSFIFQITISITIFIAMSALFYFLGTKFRRLPFLSTPMNVPVDAIISRVIEILISIPRFIVIIAIAAIVARPSLLQLVLILGLTSWTQIARLTRAEFLKVRELDYIQAGRSLGYSEIRIMFKHVLPNCIAPVLVALAFGVGSAILTESALSFLGIGVPPDVVTWGSLLADGKANFTAWWLVLFPGLAIFLTVMATNLIGEGLRKALNPHTHEGAKS